MKIKPVLIFLLTAALTGCATSYHSKNLFGGYRDQAVAADVYKVTFNGNGATDVNTTYKYAMKRCAELTLQKNKRYFEVINHRNYLKHNTSYAGGVVFAVDFPVSEIQFKIVSNKTAKAYDARKVLSQTS